MSRTAELSGRIEDAMERIRALADGNTPVAYEDETIPMFRKVRRLRRVNQSLETQMADLKAQRDRDISELDELIGQLKPMIGEV